MIEIDRVRSDKTASDMFFGSAPKGHIPASGYGSPAFVFGSKKATMICSEGNSLAEAPENTFCFFREENRVRKTFKFFFYSVKFSDFAISEVNHPEKVQFINKEVVSSIRGKNGVTDTYRHISDGKPVMVQGRMILIPAGEYTWEVYHQDSDWGDSRCGGHFS
jgi:hypothetical protein